MRNIKKFTDSILKCLTVILLAFVIAFTGTACKDKNSGNPPVNPPGGVVDDPSIEKEETLDSFLKVSKRVADEGIVLLENKDSALPLKSDSKKIALFGAAGSIQTARTGTGAGSSYSYNSIKGKSSVSSAETSIYRGFKDAGYTVTTEDWLLEYNAEYETRYAAWWSVNNFNWTHFSMEEKALTQEDLNKASDGCDTAVFTIRRIMGEGYDYGHEYNDNYSGGRGFYWNDTKVHYYLSETERANLEAVAKTFDKVIVVLNVGSVIDTKFFGEIERADGSYGLDALVYMQYLGDQGHTALVDMLTGKTNPSGKLSDTWALNYSDYPSSENFYNNSETYYYEDIYNGYRYFETFGIETAYPFGYGLSYTSFEIADLELEISGDIITVGATVKNTGSVSGKEVVQVYVSAPNGELGKASKVLAGFAKTSKLVAGGTQTVKVEFDIKDLASYDDTGKTGNKSCYVLEAGDYDILAGNSIKNAVSVGKYNVSSLRVTEECTEYLTPEKLPYRFVNNGSGEVATEELETCKNNTAAEGGYDPVELNYDGEGIISYLDVFLNRDLLDAFIGQFTNEQLCTLLYPYPYANCSGAIGATTVANPPDMTAYGIPAFQMTDGASGVKSIASYGEGSNVSYPSPTAMAHTWNPELIYKVGESIGSECMMNQKDVFLGGAVNIHRDPLCGRNFQYFSEDPLLTGKMAVQYAKGMISTGIIYTGKHYAANNKEANRNNIDSIVSERAMREIYLKAFEMLVKEAEIKSIMTSYNYINGVESTERVDLCEGILREEWGFDGFVMTDFGNNSDAVKEIIAGTDIKMWMPENNTTTSNAKDLLRALEIGTINRAQLQRAAKRIHSVLIDAGYSVSELNALLNAAQSVEVGAESVQIVSKDYMRLSKFTTWKQQEGIYGGYYLENCGSGMKAYYKIDVQSAGTYNIKVIYAADADLKIFFGLNGETVDYVWADSTGGLNVFEGAAETDIQLAEGINYLIIEFSEGNCSFNSGQISKS